MICTAVLAACAAAPSSSQQEERVDWDKLRQQTARVLYIELPEDYREDGSLGFYSVMPIPEHGKIIQKFPGKGFMEIRKITYGNSAILEYSVFFVDTKGLITDTAWAYPCGGTGEVRFAGLRSSEELAADPGQNVYHACISEEMRRTDFLYNAVSSSGIKEAKFYCLSDEHGIVRLVAEPQDCQQ